MEEGLPTRLPSLLEITEPASSFRVVLAASPPAPTETDVLSALDWQDAIAACIAAVLERGGTVVVPASPELALLAAHHAVPFTRSLDFGLASYRSPIEVYETDGKAPGLRSTLAVFARLGAVSIFDGVSQLVPLAAMEAEKAADGSASMQVGDTPDTGPGAPSLLSSLDGIIGVVLVHPSVAQARAFGMALAPGSPAVVAVWPGSGPDDPDYQLKDVPVASAVDLIAEMAPAVTRMEDAIPFGFVFELLLDTWLGTATAIR